MDVYNIYIDTYMRIYIYGSHMSQQNTVLVLVVLTPQNHLGEGTEWLERDVFGHETP